jgi:hypothetical protein
MSFLILSSIVYALIFIVFIHFFLNNFLKNERDKKKNIQTLTELPDTNSILNSKSDKKKTKKKEVKFDDKPVDEDVGNMKNDLISYLNNNNDLYKTPRPPSEDEPNYYDEDIKYEPPNFNDENTEISNFFKEVNENENEYNYGTNELFENKNKKKKSKTSNEPKVNMNSKKKIDSDSTNNSKSNEMWKYEDENIMNGGKMGGGLEAWDNTNDDLAPIA